MFWHGHKSCQRVSKNTKEINFLFFNVVIAFSIMKSKNILIILSFILTGVHYIVVDFVFRLPDCLFKRARYLLLRGSLPGFCPINSIIYDAGLTKRLVTVVGSSF